MKLLVLVTDSELRSLYEGHGAVHKGDSGVDLFCPRQILVPPDAISFKIDLGIQCAMIDDYGNTQSYFLMPRSSMGSKTPLRMANSLGMIDAGYRGNIMGVVDSRRRAGFFSVEAGSRLFQIVAPGLVPFTIELVNELPSSERGVAGFGSTGR